jgi:hypothetical protein
MVRINPEIVKDTLKISKFVRTNIDFDKTQEELSKKGYHPIRYPAGRNQQADAGNLVFYLKSGIKVNISPKSDSYHNYTIQISWDNSKIKRKEISHELKDALVPCEGEKLFFSPWRTIKTKSIMDNWKVVLNKAGNDVIIHNAF